MEESLNLTRIHISVDYSPEPQVLPALPQDCSQIHHLSGQKCSKIISLFFSDPLGYTRQQNLAVLVDILNIVRSSWKAVGDHIRIEVPSYPTKY